MYYSVVQKLIIYTIFATHCFKIAQRTHNKSATQNVIPAKKPATRNVTFRTTERLISKRTPSHVLTKGRKIEQNIVFRFVFFVFRYIFIGNYFESRK